MRKLFLIRHAQPEVTPGIPARLWPLTPDGRESAQQLAQRLAVDDRPTLLYASPELKAHETAQFIAQHLNLPLETVADLREHEREHTPFLSKDAWEATLAAFFSRPTELIFGDESAHQALQRFNAAVEKIVASAPQENLALATHGTVLTLFVASHNPQIDALAFWRSLQLPDLVVLTLPEFRLTNR
jgi:2,3-bisphosphoglycerate-dependent phosphoglycerate mutase